jgi:3-oxoacyl-[acyl-carrier-protein] synthase-3
VILKFFNKRITGILTVFPENEVKFEDEMVNYNFPAEKSLRLKKIMGYNKHRVVSDGTCISDLCVYGLEHLINEGLLDENSIDALILVTSTPDHFMPPTSNIIQGRLDLKQDMVCLDINQGCAGYTLGLIEAFLLLEQESINRVVLLNADVLSRKTSKRDRNSYPLIGDAAAVTIVEKDQKESVIYASLKNDGRRSQTIIIPAGGLRIPSSDETRIQKADSGGNIRSLENYTMDGTGVMNFVLTDVPPFIENLLNESGIEKKDIDYFMFHQPNKFMLEKLADKMGIEYSRMPNNLVENFGNSSGATIPALITYNMQDKLTDHSYQVCLSGFGVGLACSALIMDIGNLSFCKSIYYQ